MSRRVFCAAVVAFFAWSLWLMVTDSGPGQQEMSPQTVAPAVPFEEEP